MRPVIYRPGSSFWSTIDGDGWGPDFGIQGVPKLEPSEATHTRAQRRGHAFALVACSKRYRLSLRAALLRHIMAPPFFCPCVFAPQIPRFSFDPQVRSLYQAGLLLSLFFLAFVNSRSPLLLPLPSFSRWRTGTQLRASSSGLGREAPRTIRKASTGKKSRENFRKRRSVITVEL